MQMQAEVKDDWMFEEPTVAEEEREAVARQHMARAIADQVRAAMPASTVLVVARGPGVPTGVIVSNDQREPDPELDTVILAEVLAGAYDDRVAIALVRLVLGDGGIVEHTVARDRDGAVMGVIAVRPSGRVSNTWMRTVLARAANSVAGWLSIESQWAPQSLLEAIKEPALAHESGIVLVANTALAQLLRRAPNEVIGMPVGRITQRLPVMRSCSLVVGGRPRTAIVFEPRPSLPPQASVLAIVERVLAARYSFVRQTTRVSLEGHDNTAIIASPAAIEDLVNVALLDMTATFTAAVPSNHLRIRVHRDDAFLVLELVASGSIAYGPELEHLGAVICVARVRSLEGQIFLDGSRRDTRVLRISLPVAP